MDILMLLVVVIVVAILAKIFFKSMKLVWGILINALVGALVIWLLNIFGLNIAINWISALIVGFLGVPGVILLVVLKFIFHIVL